MDWSRVILFSIGSGLTVALMAGIMGATSVTGSRCANPIELTSSYSEYFEVGRRDTRSLEISFEPDALAANTTAVLGLQFCSRETTASCNDYDFDSDADGLGDTNLLDGLSIETSGVKGISGFQYLRVYESTPAGGGEVAEFTICRRRS